jgi:hypothetical protein
MSFQSNDVFSSEVTRMLRLPFKQGDVGSNPIRSTKDFRRRPVVCEEHGVQAFHNVSVGKGSTCIVAVTLPNSSVNLFSTSSVIACDAM